MKTAYMAVFGCERGFNTAYTQTGWVGDFDARYPEGNYVFVVDGVPIKSANSSKR